MIDVPVFESATSTNSITPAGTTNIIHDIFPLGKSNFPITGQLQLKKSRPREEAGFSHTGYSILMKKVMVMLLIKSANMLPTMGTRI